MSKVYSLPIRIEIIQRKYIEGLMCQAYRLPIRNWNVNGFNFIEGNFIVYSLPIRNWNIGLIKVIDADYSLC